MNKFWGSDSTAWELELTVLDCVLKFAKRQVDLKCSHLCEEIDVLISLIVVIILLCIQNIRLYTLNNTFVVVVVSFTLVKKKNKHVS